MDLSHQSTIPLSQVVQQIYQINISLSRISQHLDKILRGVNKIGNIRYMNNQYINKFKYCIQSVISAAIGMYNASKVRSNHINLLKKVSEFLQKNNVLSTNALNIPKNNVIEEEDSEGDSSMWAEMQKMAKIARQNKLQTEAQQGSTLSQDISRNYVCSNNVNTRNIISQNPQFSGQNSYTYQFTKSHKSENWNSNYKNEIINEEQIDQSRRRSKEKFNEYIQKNSKKNINSWIQAPADQEMQSDNEQVHRYEPQKKGKNKKNTKKQKQKLQRKQDNYSFQNMISIKDPNLFTIDKLKIDAPLTRNYKIGNKQEWEGNKKIDDYKLTFVLRKFPKIKQYRNNQKAIIKCSLLGNDVFVCMPTGGGKSLTFQAMTFIQKGIYLCILPLVSLIIDQQEQAKKVGIKAYSLTGSKQIQDNRMIYQQLTDYQSGSQSIVVFCTPEKVNKSPQFFSVLEQVYQNSALVKIVIDEVHCVSTWGKQFRHDYQNLSSLRQHFPKTPILGLTATVTEVIKQDIIKRLGIQNCYYFQSSFNRPNLQYEVRQKNKDILSSIIKVLSEFENKSGIIYCVSRKDCEEMCNQLQAKRFKVAFYHANISESDKRQIQAQWMANKIQIIIATIAFGMGINKPDVRFVIHHSLSKSLENYYQESGRAGRDGEEAKCILFYRRGDKISLQSLITKNEVSKDENKNFCMKQLSNMIKYCEDKYTCRRKFQLQYLGQKDFNPEECHKTCDNCKRSLQYIEVQCIKEAKYLINFLMQFEKSKQNISQNQIIMICKGNCDKKFKYKLEQIQRVVDLSELRQTFAKWNKLSIDELITQLCSYEVFYQKIFTSTFKNNTVSNFYIKVNFPLANKFMQKVETLPMKRSSNSKKGFQKQTVTDQSDYQFQFEEDMKMTDNEEYNNFQSKFNQEKYNFRN